MHGLDLDSSCIFGFILSGKWSIGNDLAASYSTFLLPGNRVGVSRASHCMILYDHGVM
jgi:hypothetical protein